MKRILLIIIILFGFYGISLAQISVREYIDTYKELAIREMNRTGIPASITLAQGILESASGNSKLATKANNHFGIKCHSSWKGKTIRKDDDRKNECFRKYPSAYDSFIDHSNFLTNGKRYAFLFEYKTTNYKKWARGLKKAGYATNPSYAKRLIDLIERYQLNRYDTNDYIASKDASPEKKETKHKKRRHSKPDFSFQLGRKVYVENRTNYIIAKKGDSYAKLTEEFQLFRWEIYRYNDVKKGSPLKKGERVYLKPKRNKTKKSGKHYHIVKKDDTPWSISQQYAIKLKKLLKRNKLNKNTSLKVGQKLKLR